MDYRKFKAPYLRRAQIWEKADALRSRFPSCATLPVPVLDLAEFDLGLELVPKAGLRQAGDIEALLLGDLKTIFVDRDAFLDPRSENRLRFSVAHELGHLILHANVYGGLRHESLEAWMEFLLAIPEVSRVLQHLRAFTSHQSRGITAMTIHQAKNREFENVIILWPHEVRGTPESLRRLLYNGVTRAKSRVLVIVHSPQDKKGQVKDRLASPPFSV